MTQAIAGVSPQSISERTVMVIWPSISMYWFGKEFGKLYAMKGPFAGNKIFWVGNLFVLLFIPASIIMYFLRILPYTGIRYRLTNRRLIVERGVTWVEEKSIGLDKFDRIEIDVIPGQEWYQAGDLVFYQGDTVVFRLEGVSRPKVFHDTLTKSHMAYAGVKKALA